MTVVQSTKAADVGFTLLEVVVGLMLTAVLVGASLTALSRYQSKLAMNQRKQRAITAADDLLHRWIDSPTGLPGAASGQVPADASLRWQTKVMSRRAVCSVPAELVRLEVWEANQETSVPRVLSVIEYVRPIRRTGGRR